MPNDQQSLDCQVSRNPQNDFQSSVNQLTVGEKFYLKCSGLSNLLPNEMTQNLKKPSDVFDFDTYSSIDEKLGIFLQNHPWPSYALKPLKIISLPNQESNEKFLLEVTSYTPGDYNANQDLFLTISGKPIWLNGFSWQVRSLLPKSPQGIVSQQVQVHPMQGFFKIPLPYLEITAWGGVFLTSLIGVFFLVNKIRKRKAEFDDIQRLKTPRSPLYEFYYKARSIEKKYLSLPIEMKVSNVSSSNAKKPIFNSQLSIFCQELNQNFRKFLAVELKFPAHLWSSKKSLNYLKKIRFYSDFLDPIKTILNELDQMQLAKERLLEEDCRQNLLLCKNLASQITDLKQKRGQH